MSGIPYIPSTAPFTAEQRAWLNGYLAGCYSDANALQPTGLIQNGAPTAATEPLLVMFGSQTGSAEQLAKRVAREAGQRGFRPEVIELNSYAKIDLATQRRLVVVTSTWGDGEPPDNAAAFWKYISAEDAPRFSQLEYSVLALGDRNYSEFCGAGKKFDERLAQLGGRRLLPRADCDVDYESAASAWMNELWNALRIDAPSASTSVQTNAAPVVKEAVGFTRSNPFPARLTTNRRLNGEGSAKDTRHFEFSLEGSGLEYEVGDALGIYPRNCPALVDEILAALRCDGEEALRAPDGSETSFRTALLQHYQITQIPNSLLELLSAEDLELKALCGDEMQDARKAFLHGREVIDLLTRRAFSLTPQTFVDALRKIQPRLYSISSSPKAHPGEVHLTVGVVRYESHGRSRKGVCSTFLAERAKPETAIPLFVQKAHSFRLPASNDTPIIMIGPGTGVAPFRAFLEERRALDAKGKTWLFFGDQCAATDFLYREQLENMRAEGSLSRLDTAFSRDQQEKIYVQHRMLESSTELWRWLEEGAHFYVCGDASRMAKDVDAALHSIIQTVGAKTREQAAEYVSALMSARRYQRDVY